jgi:hypothetical protein
MWVTRARSGLICTLLVALAVPAQAAVVVIGDIADASIRSSGTTSNGINAKRVGASTSSPGAGSRAGVFVFQLPTPGPGELPIVNSADFALNVQTNYANTLYDLDLYGLTARAANTVLTEDNYFGSSSGKHATDAVLQAGFVPAGNTITGYMHPSADADSALANYLTNQYGADGSGAGKWVFLRLNAAIVPASENTGIDVSMGEDTAAPPLLSITLVPEPAAISLLGMLSLAACVSRRRRHR